jgi:hypothetical protein
MVAGDARKIALAPVTVMLLKSMALRISTVATWFAVTVTVTAARNSVPDAKNTV